MTRNLQPTTVSKFLLDLFKKNKITILGTQLDLRDQYIINGDSGVYYTAGEIEHMVTSGRPLVYKRLALVKTITDWKIFWGKNKKFFYGLGTGLGLAIIF